MIISVLLLQFVMLKFGAVAVPPTASSSTENLQDELNSLKFAAKMLAIHIEKWNNLYISSIEPRISSSTALLASIDSNINNLQERAHVWDTFQLHVSAWNDQLATLDRKVDIISKGQEKLISLDAKMTAMANIEYKIDKILKKMEALEESIPKISRSIDPNSEYQHHQHETLFNEFAARGILSTVKSVERKLDRVILQHPAIRPRSSEETPKFTFKCNVPKAIEEVINDVSSKVDAIYDRISGPKEDNEYEIEEYDDGGSGEDDEPKNLKQSYPNYNKFIKRYVKNMHKPCKRTNQIMEDIYNKALRIENTSRVILDKDNLSLEKLDKLLHENNMQKIEDKWTDFNENLNKILDSYFSEQRAHFESSLLKQFAIYKNNLPINCNKNIISKSSTPFYNDIIIPTTPQNDYSSYTTEIIEEETISDDVFIFYEPEKQNCEDLDSNQKSGIYIFGNDSLSDDYQTHNYMMKYCLVRDDGLWTVIQRRDNYAITQNFTLDWTHYKNGFGNLSKDFWFGNDFVSKITDEAENILRIELEDFDGNQVYAEYSTFKVLPEIQNYTLFVWGYTGNASDSFSSHNGSQFSTYDRKNDEAPDCCPCAESYGGGWWFNSCFESNLNGDYYKRGENNGYFKGIIWEKWLGNYSLMKTVMMVKPKGKIVSTIPQSKNWNYYDEP